MPETADIPVADLLFDLSNPRLPEEATTQQQAAFELARQQQEQLINLAADIVDHGPDPLMLTAVVGTGDRRKRYIVLEGNRRLLALRALETPALVNGALSKSHARRLTGLARRFADNPITTLRCVRFDTEDEALHWIQLRHTSGHKGAGLVGWGSAEQDRFNARHQGIRRPGGQVLDFVGRHVGIEATAPIITTLDRLLTTPHARRKLGIDVRNREVLALYPAAELARSLGRVVEDMRSGRITVRNIYGAGDRKNYVDSLPAEVIPNSATALETPVGLADLEDGGSQSAAKARRRRKSRPPKPPRTTVIPRDAPPRRHHPSG